MGGSTTEELSRWLRAIAPRLCRTRAFVPEVKPNSLVGPKDSKTSTPHTFMLLALWNQALRRKPLNSLQKNSFRQLQAHDQENARRIQRRFGDKLSQSVKAFLLDWQHWEKATASVRRDQRPSQIVKRSAEGQGRRQSRAKVGRLLSRSQISNCGALRSLLISDCKQLNTAPHLSLCYNGTLDYAQGAAAARPEGFITAWHQWPTIRGRGAAVQAVPGRDPLRGFRDYIFRAAVVRTRITGFTNEHKVVFHVGLGGQRQGHDNGDPELRAGRRVTTPRPSRNS